MIKVIAVVATVGFFLVSSRHAYAQNSSEKKFSNLMALESSRRFPYTGKLDLGQNYPNPFKTSGQTTISYKAVDMYTASIIIYDLQGKKVLVFENLPHEIGEINIPGNQLTAGIYVYALIVNGRVIEKRKMIVE